MDLSFVQMYHFLGDTESQAEMVFIMVGVVQAIEPPEYGFFLIVRYTRAVVGHLDHELPMFLGKVKLDMAAGGCIGQCVIQQDLHHLGHTVRIPLLGWDGILGKMDIQADVFHPDPQQIPFIDLQ